MAGPQTLGRYQLERVLGKGAMGIVYEALDPKLHRKVAIKTILINQLDEDTAKDFSMRFEREARAVARLNHPNIVQVYDFGKEGEVAFLVMEFIRGTELKSSLAGNQLIDRKECVRVMCELLDALDFAHEAGVIHRDIKPANVMLDSQGRAKLTDFGVARLTDSDKTSVERTQAGTMVGTPAYMSPEQIQGQRIDRRTDIFSAGIILYQFLTGQKPFSGEGAWTVAKKIVQEEPPTPSSLNVAVSPEFDRVVAKALAKNPDTRFQTAREFARALQRAAEGKAAVQEDAAATVVVPSHQTKAAATVVPPHQAETSQALKSGEMELEFWRSIKDSSDANDYDLYVRQFPQGVYATLALRKIAKLRGLPLPAGSEDSDTRTMDGTDRTRLLRPRAEDEARTRRPGSERARTGVDRFSDVPSEAPAGKKTSLLVPGVLGALVVAGAAAYFVMNRSPQPAVATAPKVVETDEKTKRDAAENAKRLAEAQAKQEADAQAKREAEAQAQAKREAEAQAKREAEAQAQAKREAEPKTKAAGKSQAKRDTDLKAQREAEARAQREAQARAQREAEAQAQREAAARAQREAEAKAQRDAEAKAKLPTEQAFWESIKASRDPADFRQYLSRYPKGQNAEPARRRLVRLEEDRRLEEAKAAKARVEAEKRAERDRLAAEKAKLEAERKKDSAKAKPAIVVPTF